LFIYALSHACCLYMLYLMRVVYICFISCVLFIYALSLSLPKCTCQISLLLVIRPRVIANLQTAFCLIVSVVPVSSNESSIHLHCSCIKSIVICSISLFCPSVMLLLWFAAIKHSSPGMVSAALFPYTIWLLKLHMLSSLLLSLEFPF